MRMKTNATSDFNINLENMKMNTKDQEKLINDMLNSNEGL